MFVARRKPKKERLLSVERLEGVLKNSVEVISVVTDDAHFIGDRRLSNIGKFVKAKRFVNDYNEIEKHIFCSCLTYLKIFSQNIFYHNCLKVLLAHLTYFKVLSNNKGKQFRKFQKP